MCMILTWLGAGVRVTAATVLLGFVGAAHANPGPTASGDSVPGGEQVTVTLTLTGRDDAALARHVTAAASADIRHRSYLTREHLRDRFGAPADRVSSVERWARTAGLRVAGLDSTGTRLSLTGTAKTVATSLGVGLRQRTTHGVRTRTASAPPRVPAAVAGDVRAVTGLVQHAAWPMLARAVATPSAAAEDQDCAAFWAQRNNTSVPQRYPAGRQSNPLCGYTGAQLRALYGLTGDDHGQGQTITIVGAYHNPPAFTDANTTFARQGVPPLPADRFQVKTYVPGGADNGCDIESWHAEQALDIQAAHTIAPEATIVYAAAPDCTQLEETVAAVVADDSIDTTVISASWGLASEPEDADYLAATNDILARATVLGIGVYAASGDLGDNTTLPGATGPSVVFPASSPWVTAVGGTTSAVGEHHQVLWQTGWEPAANALRGGAWTRLDQPFLRGGGGGTSARFDKPTWQQAVPGTRRAVPDLAALADPYTGFLVGYTIGGRYLTTPLGGTSLAAPIVASLVAVAQGRTGGTITAGLLAPVLYAEVTGSGATVTDVQHVAAGIWTPAVSSTHPHGDYLLDVDAAPQSLRTVPGYDPVTGLGVPGPAFVAEVLS